MGSEEKRPRINVYKCEYGCHTITVDVDHGVTPFMIKCRSVSRPGRPLNPKLTGNDGECIGIATSSFYPKGPKPSWIGEPTHEWRLPTKEEVDNFVKEGEENGVSETSIREYYNGEHLSLFPRSSREPIYHDK